MYNTVTRGPVWSPESAHASLRRQVEGVCPDHRPVLRSFVVWLTQERGLVPSTAGQRLRSAASFLAAVATPGQLPCEQALASLDAQGIEVFFVQFGQSNTRPTLRIMQTAMRLFLRFAALQGWVGSELAAAVPSLVTWRLSGLPRRLSGEQLTTLLTSPWDSGECPLRDRAIVELLATYGVRSLHVAALQLGDIDWRERSITFAAHKRGKAIHQELTARVAQSLAEYLRHERPSSDSASVFLRSRPPHQRLASGSLSAVVRARMVRCGLPPSYPRTLRHTFATRLLRAGQPLKVIADLLGHRSLTAVAIYAKVDFTRLLEVAGEWPEEVS
jgi:site-specific recombinase XerD